MKKTPEILHKVKLPEITLELSKDYIEVCCPSCNSPTAAADMNIHDKVAKCIECNVLFPIHKEINSLSQTLIPESVPKTPIHRPVGIDIFRYKGELDFTYQEAPNLGPIFLFLMLLLFSVAATIFYFTKGISIWYPIGTWILTILNILYFSSAFSKTTLNIDDERLTIKKHSNRWSKDIMYPIHEVDQLYTKFSAEIGYYNVYIIINSIEGQKHVHLASFDTRSKAQYLEQEIENHLGISDRPVSEAS